MDLKGNDPGLVDVLHRYLPGGTEEDTEILSENSGCPGRDPNRASPE